MATHVFRFALGSPESPRSAVWRLWTKDNDTHASVVTPRGELVLTVYPTGRWRIALGKDVSRWNRPPEFRPGWTRGPEIILPSTGAMVPLPSPEAHAAEPITWLEPPAAGQAARFTLLLASPRAEESHWRPHDAPGTQGVTVLPLRTAGYLHLSRIDAPIPVDEAGPGPEAFDVVVSADEAGRPSLRELHPQ